MARSNLHRPKDKEKPPFPANADNHKEVFMPFAESETGFKEINKETTPAKPSSHGEVTPRRMLPRMQMQAYHKPSCVELWQIVTTRLGRDDFTKQDQSKLRRSKKNKSRVQISLLPSR